MALFVNMGNLKSVCYQDLVHFMKKHRISINVKCSNKMKKQCVNQGISFITCFFLSIAVLLTTTTRVFADCEDEAAPGVNWTGCDKSSLNLQNADLSGAILTKVDFSDTNLSGARITDAELNFSDLTHARFDHARLTNSRLIAVKGDKASFVGADMAKVRLSRAKLKSANFSKARMPGAGFYASALISSDFSGADLYPPVTNRRVSPSTVILSGLPTTWIIQSRASILPPIR